jgi:hypothetical protein
MEMPGGGKRGKPKAGFPSFPTALGNRQNRDSHIPTAPVSVAVEKWKSKSRIPTFPPHLPLPLTQKPTQNKNLSASPTSGSFLD